MTPSDIYNLASNLIRPALVSVPGVAIPPPYGGTTSDVEVDLDQTEAAGARPVGEPTYGTHWQTRTSCCRRATRRSAPIDYLVETNATAR